MNNPRAELPFSKENLYDTCTGVNLANLFYQSMVQPDKFSVLELLFGYWEFSFEPSTGLKIPAFEYIVQSKRKLPVVTLPRLDNETARKLEAQCIASGNRMLVYIDEFYAPWCTDHYRRKHNKHAVLLTGIDDGNYEVMDAYRTVDQCFKIDETEFGIMRGGTTCLNSMIFVRGKLQYRATEASFNQFIEKARDSMENGGFAALASFIQAIENQSMVFADMVSLHRQIRVLNGRKGLCQYLMHGIASWWGDEELVAKGRALLDLWYQLGVFLMSETQRPSPSKRRMVIAVINKIMIAEKELLSEMCIRAEV